MFNTTTTESNVFKKNYTYSLKSNKNNFFKIKIKCIDSIDIYDIILINKSKKDIFELDNIYKMMSSREVQCKTNDDLFNTKKDNNGIEKNCCNI